MVAAGVIPIDRLTDIRAPIDVVAARCGPPQLEAVYGIQLGPRTLDAATAADNAAAAAAGGGSSAGAGTGSSNSAAAGSGLPAARVGAGPPASAEAALAVVNDQVQLSTGTRLLISLARARGWTGGGGLPDEARAGRQILRDYTIGKLLYCKLPPGSGQQGFAPLVAPLPGTVNGMQLPQHSAQQQLQAGSSKPQQQPQAAPAGADQQQQQHDSDSSSSGDESEAEAPASAAAAAAEGEEEVLVDPSSLMLSEADLELMDGMGIGGKAKAKRPEHKFHKKAARTKGTRGLQADAGGYDGAALSTGKKGGLVRVGGY